MDALMSPQLHSQEAACVPPLAPGTPLHMDLDAWLPCSEPSTGKPLPRRTLLMLAAQDGSVAMMRLALGQGATVNLQSPDDGTTALHCAASSAAVSIHNTNTLEAIRLLLDCGADRNLQDRHGRRPLDVLFAQSGSPMPMQSPASPLSRPQAFTARSTESSADGSEAACAPLRTSHRDQEDTPHTTAEFRMFQFKIDDCPHECLEDHDWTECPFAHPGEKARRRCPRKFQYTSTPCPDFRKGTCKRGDVCTYAHGVFEGWLHPGKYRTQMCKDGATCSRLVCFFAHTLQELRAEPEPRANVDAEQAPPRDRSVSPEAAALPTWASMSPSKATEVRSGATTPTASERECAGHLPASTLGGDLPGFEGLSLNAKLQGPSSPFGHDSNAGLALSPASSVPYLNSPIDIARAALSSRTVSSLSSRSTSPARRNGAGTRPGSSSGKVGRPLQLQAGMQPQPVPGRLSMDPMLMLQQEQQMQAHRQQHLQPSRNNSRKGKNLLQQQQQQPSQQLLASLQQLQRQQLPVNPLLYSLQLQSQQQQVDMLSIAHAVPANAGAVPLSWQLHSAGSEPTPLSSGLAGLGNTAWPSGPAVRPVMHGMMAGAGDVCGGVLPIDNLLQSQLVSAALMGIPEQAAMRCVATLPGDVGGWNSLSSPPFSGAGSPVQHLFDTPPLHNTPVRDLPGFSAQCQQQMLLGGGWRDSMAGSLSHRGLTGHFI